jgi:predicted Zn-dependent protease
MGFAQLQQKHYADAVDALQHATGGDGATGYMWNNLGTAYEQLGQFDEARAAFAAGGKLGSPAALASAKRLVGVTSVVATAHAAPAAKKDDAAEVHEYEAREPEVEPEVEAEPAAAGSAADAGTGSAEQPAQPQTL